MGIGRNDPCYCGSGEKYKRCHLDIDREAEQALREALPVLAERHEKLVGVDRRLRDEYGVHINYVSPTVWNGGKVWAIGSRVYIGRPTNETFHEFIISVLRETFGEEWRALEAARPEDQRHVVLRCSDEWGRWTMLNADAEVLARDGYHSGRPNGWVQYLISLAWDVATIIHASNMPSSLVDRLRDAAAFQGARYEVAIAAIFARLDCEIRFLDEEEELRGDKHVEFVATHRPTGQQIAVEAKSRHRAGVLHQAGEPDLHDPLHGDARGVRRLFMNAVEKAPEATPFMVFIDINAPTTSAEIETRWQTDVQQWMGRLPMPTAEKPDVYNALYVTNFSPHYDADELSTGGTWLSIAPRYARIKLAHDLTATLFPALSNYARVPAFAENGELL
jgi:hypothetical protein